MGRGGAGLDGGVGPGVGGVALEGVGAFVEVADEADRTHRGGVDPDGGDVFEVVEPAVGGQRASDADNLVEGLAVAPILGGADLDGSHFRVGEHPGLVAYAVVELFARVVELCGEGRGGRQQQYGEQKSFHLRAHVFKG